MIKYKLTYNTYYSPFWFCRVKWPVRTMIVKLKTGNKKEKDEIEQYLRCDSDDEFEWEFISKTYKLTDCTG